MTAIRWVFMRAPPPPSRPSDEKVRVRQDARECIELLEGEPPAPAERVRDRRGPLSAALYSAALLIGILLLPRLAAVGYLLVAVRAVLFPGGEGRLTLRGRDVQRVTRD
jgi:hypothetical protein